MKVAVTGHRPNKMFGYDIYNDQWCQLKESFKKILLDLDCEEAITGMALGVDTVFALAVLELKDEGYNIKLHCAIPCKFHSSKWPIESQKLYDDILSRADTVFLVTNTTYKPYTMQVRNEYMVDLADLVIAVWDGSAGGTYNCLDYARRCKKRIIRINPKDYI